jgi:thioredoxin
MTKLIDSNVLACLSSDDAPKASKKTKPAKEVSKNFNFERDVVKRSHTVPVFVDFHAKWCGPCQAIAPHVEALKTKYDGKCDVIKCDVDEHEKVADKYHIEAVPTFLLFVAGKVAATIEGGTTKGKLEAMIKNAL